MLPYVLTLSLLLHMVAAITSQFMQQPFPYYQQGQPQQQMQSMPIMQMPGAQAGMPAAMQMPHGAQMMSMANMPPMMPHMPRLPGMPAHMPPAMHMPMPLSHMNGGRLPMVVMPHYSKKADKPSRRKPRKPKRKRIKMDSLSSEDSCSESAEFRSRNNLRSSKKRREVLTPVVSYVTKDGYVVYQKKIKKDKAKDWLELSKAQASSEFKDNVKTKKREENE